ncbi:MAG: molybdate ABC transporter permease subunit [Solirubrobacterales bacterium]|nr:molybdate ABC transporter permease subunit [Solirubrobacterales bacterium]
MSHSSQTRPPGTLLPPAILAVCFLVLPLLALLLKLPWGSATEILSREETLQALGLSLGTATGATLVCILIGVPLAWWLVWLSEQANDLPYRILRALVLVPLVLPPVVGGVALLLLLGRRGVLGGPLFDLTGFAIPFTTVGVITAQVFVALPFLILSVEGALRTIDRRIEEVALDLGANPLQVLLTVTLPILRPAIVAGAVLSFARALGEFGATITLAGNFPGVTRTMPIATYTELQTDPDAAITLSVILLAVSVAILVSLRGRWAKNVFG